MPVLPEIPEPTKFSDWKAAGALFDADAATTETHVVNGPQDGIRLAYGRTAGGFAFFISMTREEEIEFRALYQAWRARAGAGDHQLYLASIGKPPPECGTPNTPPCPCFDPLGGETNGLDEQGAVQLA
jgi:hypothetical protein